MKYWLNFVKEQLEKMGIKNIDPRHILGYVLLCERSLSGMTEWELVNEIKIGIACVKEGGLKAAESCAQSYGL